MDLFPLHIIKTQHDPREPEVLVKKKGVFTEHNVTVMTIKVTVVVKKQKKRQRKRKNTSRKWKNSLDLHYFSIV